MFNKYGKKKLSLIYCLTPKANFRLAAHWRAVMMTINNITKQHVKHTWFYPAQVVNLFHQFTKWTNSLDHAQTRVKKVHCYCALWESCSQSCSKVASTYSRGISSVTMRFVEQPRLHRVCRKGIISGNIQLLYSSLTECSTRSAIELLCNFCQFLIFFKFYVKLNWKAHLYA